MCLTDNNIPQNPSHFEGSPEEKNTASQVENNFMDYIQNMKFFDPHIHMVSRTTDDYQALDRKSTRLNSSHVSQSRMPSSA